MGQVGLRIVALVAACSLAAPALAQPARTDIAFAGAGLLTLPWPTSNLEREVAAAAPDGGLFLLHEGPQDITVMRLRPDGSPYPEYVGGGVSRVPLAEAFNLSAVHVAQDGSLVLGGGRDLIRVDSFGRVDESFGDKGRTRIPYVSNGACLAGTARAVLPAADGGWISVGGRGYVDATSVERGCTLIGKVRADGAPDIPFGVQGNLVRPGLVPFDARMREDGSVEIIGRYAGQFGSWVERVAPDGRMLPSFGSNGSMRLADNGPQFTGSDGRILPDGSLIFLAATSQPTIVMHRFRPDFRFEPMFAGVGRTVIGLRDGPLAEPRVLPVPDGGFIVRGVARTTFDFAVFYKVDARGIPDRTFGDNGYARHLAALNSRVLAWHMQPDGYLFFSAASYSVPPATSPAIPSPPPPYVVAFPHATRIQAVPDIVEFHNTIIDHYFIAYDGLEASGIDDGAAGPGWVRTGQSFHPGGTTPVCRFYGTPGMGPNSHFFTIEPGECELVKRDPGWTYEGLGFYGTRLVDGRCPDPLVTVRRLYNNRHAVNDANHRYITDLDLVPAMAARGWALEGPVFCAKP